MVWTTIPNGDVDADSPITTALITALRDNVTALANGDAGAPEIQTAAYAVGSVDQTALGANSVGQSEVKTAGQQINAASSDFTATGGIYILGHTARRINGTDNEFFNRRSSGTADSNEVAQWFWQSTVSGDDVGTLFYINSSPPYDLGDGQIPLFVDAVMEASGDIAKLSVAPDPVWAYNGPTNCVPAVYARDGKTYRSRRDMTGLPMTWREAVTLGSVAIDEYLAAFAAAPIVLEEITQAIKNADKDIVPHVFASADAVGPGQTAIMLDPVSPVLERLAAMLDHDEGRAEVTNIIRNYLVIDNQPAGRQGPQNILIPSIRWK